MKKYTILFYGILSYVIFLGVFVYAIGFIGNIFVETSIDSNPTKPMWLAIIIDVGLLVVFALQHSIMARPAFKRVWTKVIPEAAERSTYVLFSSLAMILMFWFWEPIGGLVWYVSDPVTSNIVMICYFIGWATLFVATCLIDHFDLFGLRQVWLQFKGRTYVQPSFRTPYLYAFVRHPIYLGWLMIIWFTPIMTSAHLLFAVITTVYILFATKLEERDLIDAIGQDYRNYREEVSMILPFLNSLKTRKKTVVRNKVYTIEQQSETVKSPYRN